MGKIEKMNSDYIIYRTKEDLRSKKMSSYLRIIDNTLTFEIITEHIKEIKSIQKTNEDFDILFAIINNSNSFVFLNAKELIIQPI